MLNITLRDKDSVALFDENTDTLIGFIFAHHVNHRADLGFEFPKDIGIVRLEITPWGSLSIDELKKIPFGTKMPPRERKGNGGGVRPDQEAAVHQR